MNLLFFILGILFGFFLPGFIISKLLKSSDEIPSSILISSVLLFNVIFYLGIINIKIEYRAVMIVLLIIILALYVISIIFKKELGIIKVEYEINRSDFLLLIPSVFILVLLGLRLIIQPFGLAPGDQLFRWNFLAVKMFNEGQFSFYPPVNACDFAEYYYTDGIPPLVSFIYFWLYESSGHCISSITALSNIVQFILILYCVFRLSSKKFSNEAGTLSVLFLCSSPLFFYSIHMGQESGLMSLSLVSTIYFLLLSENKMVSGNIIIAGFCASLGALSREYGYAVMISGIITLVCNSASFRQHLFFVITCLIFSFPWYLRNWIIAGNPFYSNDVFGIFNVNPVHVGIMDIYRQNLGFSIGFKQKISETILSLLLTAFLPLIFGFAGMIKNFRKHYYWAVAVIMFTLLWIYSVAYTPGGLFHSLRVLCPCLVLMSCAGAGFMICRFPLKHRKSIKIFALLICCISFLQSFTMPVNCFLLPLNLWIKAALDDENNIAEEIYLYNEILPLNSRVITDNPVFNTRLYNYTGKKIDLVAVWSPEIRFLFDPKYSYEESKKLLEQRNIRYLIIGQNSLNFKYFTKYPFFADFSSRFTKIYGDLYTYEEIISADKKKENE